MELKYIIPFVRYARYETNFDDYNDILYACDNRLYYCIEGKTKIEIDGKVYLIEKDTAIMWRAGLGYKYLSEEGKSFKVAAINFDFTTNDSNKTIPYLPLYAKRFSASFLTENVDIQDVPAFEKIYMIKKAIEIKKYFTEIIEEYCEKNIFANEKISSLLKISLTQLARDSLSENTLSTDSIANQILQYIKGHCTENITNDTIGKIYGYHPNYINSLFLNKTGITLHKYLLNCRVDFACYLMEKSSKTISEIAQECGFSSVCYFSRYFKKCKGMSPSRFSELNNSELQ